MTPGSKAVEAWNVDWINDWMGRHDVHLPNPAYAELKRALSPSPVQARTGEVTEAMKAKSALEDLAEAVRNTDIPRHSTAIIEALFEADRVLKL